MTRWQTLLWQDRRLGWVVVVWLILVGALCVRTFSTPLKGNVFLVYSEAGRHWNEGATCYDADRAPPYDGYRYAPIVSTFFVPWSWLPLSVASALWRCVNAVTLFGGFIYFMRTLSSAPSLTTRDWTLMLLAMIPLGVAGLNNGQVNPLIVGLLLIAVAGCREERWNLAAFCIVLATCLKVYPLAMGMLLILVYPRTLTWRIVLGLVCGGLLPFLAQSPDYVVNEYRTWFEFLRGDDRRHNPFPVSYLDVHLLLRIAGVQLSHGVYAILQLGSAALLALFVWQRSRTTGASPQLLASLFHLGCGWMMLFGPSTEGSTYVMLAPTLACALLDATRDPRTASWQRGAVYLAAALFLTRFIWIALPGGRLYTFALPPIGALLLWTERWSRALPGETTVRVSTPEVSLRRAG